MLQALVRKYLSFLFPGTGQIPATNLPKLTPKLFRGSIYLHKYQEPTIQQAIKRNKYHYDQNARDLLGQVLQKYLEENVAGEIYLIPVPQSYKRWRERGFDHLEEIIRHTKYKNNLQKNILQKHTHTKRQAHVSRPNRLRQQAGTYACNADASKLRGTVILFDDVVTTGSTMLAARATLAPKLPKDTRLICLAIAH